MAGILDLLSGNSSQPSAPRAGGTSDFLRRLAPAIAMIDPRNAQLGMGLMAMNADRDEQAAKQQNRNQTASWLQQQGMGAEEAAYLASDPGALRAWYSEWKTGGKPEWKIQRLLNDQGREQDFMVDMNNPERRNPIGGARDVSASENKPASVLEFEYGVQNPAYREWAKSKGRDAPLTATDKKAILEADDMVQSNQTVVDQLKSVLAEPDGPGSSLNDRAGSGALAGTQSWLARNDPTGLFSDAKGEATTELSNVVLNQALGSLKSIFGAAPTEGERRILVDLQASIDKTPAERKAIIDRGIALAERRLRYNQERANSLRSEDYYKVKPEGAQAAPPKRYKFNPATGELE